MDCNNFYASCERVFNPKIENKPVIVLSNNDGCVIARSNEAKALGIKMGEPAFKLKNLIEKYNINVFSTNFALYGDLSKRVMNIMSTEVEKMEIYSIDEAFLDFSDYASKKRGLAIREKVKKWTGIPVSVGIAPTKVLAKVAGHIAKKHTKSGVFIFDDEDLIRRALNFFKVEDLWGIGSNTAKKLKSVGIHTALQFRQCDSSWVKRNLSVNGVRLQKELFGEVCYPIETKIKRRKSICTARSFGSEINKLSKLKEVIGSHANTCATKLRKEKSCCTTVGVFLSTNPFKPQAKQYNPYTVTQLHVPTNDSMEIVKVAIKALESIYRGDCIYKKAGVVVSRTVPQEQTQLSLFDSLDRGKRENINIAVDKVNSLMGKNKVHLAVQGNGRKWKIKQERLSPCYTTRFADILEVRI
ncbi:MAG: Y-family DNA polymerase [Bacteroidetes bacterium]|nr:Y-family DNA polymerase [Bacteroidota bacterium]